MLLVAGGFLQESEACKHTFCCSVLPSKCERCLRCSAHRVQFLLSPCWALCHVTLLLFFCLCERLLEVIFLSWFTNALTELPSLFVWDFRFLFLSTYSQSQVLFNFQIFVIRCSLSYYKHAFETCRLCRRNLAFTALCKKKILSVGYYYYIVVFRMKNTIVISYTNYKYIFVTFCYLPEEEKMCVYCVIFYNSLYACLHWLLRVNERLCTCRSMIMGTVGIVCQRARFA